MGKIEPTENGDFKMIIDGVSFTITDEDVKELVQSGGAALGLIVIEDEKIKEMADEIKGILEVKEKVDISRAIKIPIRGTTTNNNNLPISTEEKLNLRKQLKHS